MPTPLRLEALLVKPEASYGVDATPGATDALRMVGERLWTAVAPEHVFPNDRDDVMNNSLTPLPGGIPRGRVMPIRGPWEVKGKGSAYAVEGDLEANPWFKACGFSVAVDTTGGSEKVTYTPADTGHGSACAYAYAGGQRYKPLGIRGDFVWKGEAGKLGRIDFDMRGLLATDPDTQSVPSATFDSSTPPAAIGVGLSLNPGSAWTPEALGNWEFQLGNRVETIEDAQAADGLSSIEIVERKPRLIIEVRQEALATYNPYSLLAAKTNHTASLTLGQAQYNRLKLPITQMCLLKEPENIDYMGRGFAGWRLTYEVQAFTIVAD